MAYPVENQSQASTSAPVGDDTDDEDITELLESESGSDESLDFPTDDPQMNNQMACEAYTAYAQAASVWENVDFHHTPPATVEELHKDFLQKARRWNKFRKFGRRRRDLKRRQDPHIKRRKTKRKFGKKTRFRFHPKRRRAFAAGSKNPVGADGTTTQCSICKSEEHLRAHCPKKPKWQKGKFKKGMKGGQKSNRCYAGHRRS